MLSVKKMDYLINYESQIAACLGRSRVMSPIAFLWIVQDIGKYQTRKGKMKVYFCNLLIWNICHIKTLNIKVIKLLFKKNSAYSLCVFLM